MIAVAIDPVRVGVGARRRLALALWSAGMLGVLAMTLLMLPALLAKLGQLGQFGQQPLPMPIWLLSLLSLLQSGGLLAVAVWAGMRCAAPVGLRAPGFEAWAAQGDLRAALRPQWLPGTLAGVIGGVGLLASVALQPPALAAAADALAPPLAVRLLYGGITEELLLRWGLMSWLLWVAWRVRQRGTGTPRTALALFAIVLSAVLFGVGHLPAAHAILGGLDLASVAFVIGVNTAFGLLFGALYWRVGLEAAMLAHGVAHLVAWIGLLA